MTKDEIKKMKYDLLIDRTIKKSYPDVLSNPTGFVRGIDTELLNDIRMIKSGKLPAKPNNELVDRIKYVSELSLSKMSDRRKKLDSDLNSYVKDYFTEYQDALKWAKLHLKDSRFF